MLKEKDELLDVMEKGLIRERDGEKIFQMLFGLDNKCEVTK